MKKSLNLTDLSPEDELSISDVSQGEYQTIHLKDSLDLSKLKISQDDRAVLAQILTDLSTELSIPCPHVAINLPKTNSVILAWHYKTANRALLQLELAFNFKTNKADYSISSASQTSDITYEQFTTTAQAISVLKINQPKVSQTNQYLN